MFGDAPTAEVAEVVEQMHALRSAADAQLLAALPALRASEVWRDDGCTSLVDWLVLRLGVLRRTAAELIDVADRLRSLPALARAYGEGRLSWDQLRFAVVLATPDDDAAVAADAAGRTARELELLAKQQRRVDREEAERRHRKRSLRFRPACEGMTRLSGLLPDADAAVVRVPRRRRPRPARIGPARG